MRKLAIAALIAATLSASVGTVWAAQYECADGTILTTGTMIEKSYIHPITGELIVSTSILEAKMPLVIWQKSECRLREAKNFSDAKAYGKKISAYVSKWGASTLEELFPERFGK